MAGEAFPEMHCFTVKGRCFVLDVEGNRVYTVSAAAAGELERLRKGRGATVASLLDWPMRGEVASLLRTMRSNHGRREQLAKRFATDEPMEMVGLWLGLSHACNLACAYCFANEPNYLQANAAMSWETARTAVDFLLASSPDREEYELIFFGGEPLLQFDLLRRVVDYCESKQGKRFAYSITTNGTLLTRPVAEFLAAHDVSIMLSIDGTRELHDRNRRYRDGTPSFDDILANVRQIPDFGRLIAARVTVPNTEVPLLEIYRSMKAVGFESITLIEVCPNSGELPMFPQGEIGRWKQQHLELAEHLLESEPNAYDSGPKSIVGFAHSIREGERSFYCCGTGIHYFYVTPNGDCYPCMRLITQDEKNKMGSVYSGIDRSKVERFRSNHIFNRSCARCWARYLCGGMCYGDSFALTGDIKSPVSVFCQITQHKIEVSAYLLWQLEQDGKVPPATEATWLTSTYRTVASWLGRSPR